MGGAAWVSPLLAADRLSPLQTNSPMSTSPSAATVEHQGQLQRFAPVDLLALAREALRDVVPRAEPQPVVRLWVEGDPLSKAELADLHHHLRDCVRQTPRLLTQRLTSGQR